MIGTDPHLPAPVWFVTGCSTGLGRALSSRVLAAGDRVALTARDPSTLDDLVAGHPGAAIALPLDVTRPSEIEFAVAAATKTFGTIDVLVNNAGYAYFAPAEEGDDSAVRAMFDVNFFGLAAMTRAVLPAMRARRRGTIVNISSIAGLTASAGAAYYAASKFAVEGFSEGLALDVEGLGSRVIAVGLGQFRTRFVASTRSEPDRWHPDYAATVGARRAYVRGRGGREPGDPERAAAAIYAAANSLAPPARLVLGNEALASARRKVATLASQVDAIEAIARSTDFPG